MYRVRHLARAHGKSQQVLMRMSLAFLSNHATVPCSIETSPLFLKNKNTTK